MNNDREGMLTKVSPWLLRIRDWIDPLVRRLCQNTERRDQMRRERIATWGFRSKWTKRDAKPVGIEHRVTVNM
jgi:hypothetical protein